MVMHSTFVKFKVLASFSRKETESTKSHQDIDMHFNQEKDVDLGLKVNYK